MLKNKQLLLKLYSPNEYIPNISTYSLYFIQNRKKFPFNLLKTTITSYLGGVVFGGMMLGLSLLNNVGISSFDYTGDISAKANSYKFQNFQEFKNSCILQLKSLHQNGLFVIRYTLFMGLVNYTANYLPILNSSFNDLYGYKRLSVLNYGVIPLVVYFGCKRNSFPMRVMLSGIVPVSYFTSRKIKNMVQKRKSVNKYKI